MDYKIVEKPQFTVVGKAIRVSTKDGENLRRIPQFWGECMQDGTVGKLYGFAAHGKVLGNLTLGICTDFAPDMSEFTYMIGAESPGNVAPSGLELLAVAPHTWAAFEAVGPMPDSIQSLWARIWSEFFPEGKYEHVSGPDIELYPSGDPFATDYRTQVWIPVSKK